MKRRRQLLLLALLTAAGCAPRQPITAWGYSSWYRQGGGEMGAFESQRRVCLERIGSGADPAAVRPDSPEENRFLECMNAAGWCTESFACQKPGAS
jgi:hypothetical protein